MIERLNNLEKFKSMCEFYGEPNGCNNPDNDCTYCDDLDELIDESEQGILLRSPCKVGDIIYEIDLPEYGIIECEVLRTNAFSGYICGVKSNDKVNGISVYAEVVKGHGTGSTYNFEQSDFGKTAFLTRQEAEQALRGESIGQ